MIVATAGHVDHGKTSLVKQLSGVDTDRLEEEKRRGLSINLGFAYNQLGSDYSIGFIDVPGHNRFINTMISGVSGIDVALLVVAADDGVMPQTLEHLDVLRLLGVGEYVAVISKTDRVDKSRVEEVSRQVLSLVPDSSPLYPIDNIGGDGIEELKGFLHQRAENLPKKAQRGHFRMPIDRSFLLKGTGLVVTGTALSGGVRVGDQLHLLPQNLPVRVRGIHAQGEVSDRGGAGQRCAIDVTGVGKDQIERGDWLQASELAQSSDCVDARVELLANAPFSLKHLAPVKLYLGAKRIPAKIYLIEQTNGSNRLRPGDSVFAQLILESPVACCRGDRFLLRDDSESFTIAGGVVLDPFASRMSRRKTSRIPFLEALESSDIEAVLIALLLDQGQLLNATQLRRAWNLSTEEFSAELERDSLAPLVKSFSADREDYLIAQTAWNKAELALCGWLKDWHSKNPQQEGAQAKLVRHDLESTIPSELFLAVMSHLLRVGKVKLANGLLALGGHVVKASNAEQKHWREIRQTLEKSGIQIPVLGALLETLSIDEPTLKQAFRKAIKSREVIQIAERRYALCSTLSELAQAVNELAQTKSEFSVIDVKNHLGLGRNLTIELLEHFDSIGFTVRRGDSRSIIDSGLPARLFAQS
ncbi:MAG: selenocysteine-specific translation elongation factor [Halioglobus sp.]